MNSVKAEFLYTDTNMFVPVQMVNVNQGFGSSSPDISSKVSVESAFALLEIEFPLDTSAIVFLINKLTGGIDYVQSIRADETRVSFRYNNINEYWVYVITKEYDDGFITLDNSIRDLVDEQSRFTTIQSTVLLTLTIDSFLKTVDDSEEANQWYGWGGTYDNNSLVWELPPNAEFMDIEILTRDIENLYEEKEALTTIFNVIKKEFRDNGLDWVNQPSFNGTEDNAKEIAIRMYKVVDRGVMALWDLDSRGDQDGNFDDWNNEYNKNVIYTKFRNSYTDTLGITNYEQNFSSVVDRYAFTIDRLNLAGDGGTDRSVWGVISNNNNYAYAECQVGFSPTPFSWTEEQYQGRKKFDPTTWVSPSPHYPVTEDGATLFNRVKYICINPLVGGRELNRGGRDSENIGAFNSGGDMILDIFNNPQYGILATFPEKIDSYGVGRIGGTGGVSFISTWWDNVISKTSNWFNEIYGEEDNPGWIFTELDRINSDIREKRELMLYTYANGSNVNSGTTGVAHEATLQNIRFIKNMINYLDDNIWSTLLNTNTEMLSKLISIEKYVTGGENVNTLVNITTANVNLADVEISYRKILDDEWHQLNTGVVDLSNDVKGITLPRDYFNEVGKYVVMVRPKQIHIDVDSITGSIIRSYQSLSEYSEHGNYFYGWNIQFETPTGELRGSEKMIVASHYTSQGQYLQISPLIDGAVSAIGSDVKARIWNSSFIPIMIEVDLVEHNNLTLSYSLYGKKEMNKNTGLCVIYDHNGNPYREQSFGTYSTEETNGEIIDYRLPMG